MLGLNQTLASPSYSYSFAYGNERNEAEGCNDRGIAYIKRNKLEQAIASFSKAIELNSSYANAYCNRGVVYYYKGEYERAIIDYNEAIELNSHHVIAYNNRGVAYGNKGEQEKAIGDFTRAIKTKPDYADAYNNRGNVYGSKSEYDRTIADYTKAIELKVNYTEAYNNRGNAYGNKGEYDRAIADYAKAIELNTKFADAYHNRAVAYYNRRDFDSAIKNYNIAVELSPKFANAYYGRGVAYGEKGDFDRAIKDYTKVVELNPEFINAYISRAIAYRRTANFDFAIEDYTKAIELNPDNPDICHGRAIAYGEKGDFDRAIKDYTKVVELNPNFTEAYYNRGVIYSYKGDFDRAIKDYTKAIELNPDDFKAYNNIGVAYIKKGEVDLAIKNYNAAIELNPDDAIAYCNRGEAWLRLKEWDKAKTDLIAAKKMGMDIIASFHNDHKNVEAFEQRHRVKLPEDLALLLTQRRRTRYPKMQTVLDADGKPIESPNVVNLRSQLRDAGTPLGEYIKTKPAFGINIAPTEVFVVDKATRDKLIAAHPSSADVLKPFLHGQELRRWHVDTPHQWLIFTHRGIAINDYPAILQHLEKYRESLSKRKGKQAWYELPASFGNAERFAQPKLVCPDTYNHQTFAVDRSDYYYGNTSYLIPTEETWLCGLLNSRTVEWFYSQVSNQLTIDPLRARSGYIQQIPIPDLTSIQKALIGKIVDYLIYLQQQPTINSKDLAHARDHIMLGYYERIIDGLVYEVYLPEDLHKGDKHFFQPLLEEQLPSYEEIQEDKMTTLREIFELLYERTHLVRRDLYYLDSVKAVRIIEGKI